MYLSASFPANEYETQQLSALIDEFGDGHPAIALCEADEGNGYVWVAKSKDHTISGRGVFSGSISDGATSIAEAGKIIFSGNRVPYSMLLNILPSLEQKKCLRKTYVGDCRLGSAYGLHDEQAWCETAAAKDQVTNEKTAYLVQVLGTNMYFGYFNFQWEKGDRFNIKCCHDLNQWASLYIPNMYAQRDVERWVFLERDVFKVFLHAVPDYSRVFLLKQYGFEEFSKETL